MAIFRPSRLFALSAIAVALSAAPKAQALSLYWYGGDHDLWSDQNWTGGIGGYYEDLTFPADVFFGFVGFDDTNGIVTNDGDGQRPINTLNFTWQDWHLNGNGGFYFEGRGTISAGTGIKVDIDNFITCVGTVFPQALSTMSLHADAGGQLNINTDIWGTAAVYKSGLGTASLTRAHTYTNGTNVAAGRLIDYRPSGNYYTNADLEFNTAFSQNFGGTVNGGGAFTKSGGGNLYLNGDASWTGATTVNEGRLIIATPWYSSSYVTNTGTELEFRTGNGTYTHDISGGGTFFKSGPGTLTLTGNNTYTGGTYVNEGALIDKNPHGGYANNSILYFDTAGSHTLNKPITGAGTLFKTGSGTVTLAGLNTFTGTTAVIEGSLLDYNPHGTYLVASELQFLGEHTYANVISGAGHFTKGGPGILTLTGVNTYTGGTRVDGGTLIDTHPHGNYNNGSQLEFRNSADVVFLDQATGAPYSISGLGHFTKSGAGGLILFAPNSYAGSTTINEGAIFGLVNNALPTSTALTVAASGQLLPASGISQTVASLAGAGKVGLSGGNLTVDGSASTGFSGVVSGNGTLVKSGAGTLTLSGVNTYSAGTTVNGGRLIDSNPHGSYVTNAALEFSKAADYAYSTAITGTGSFTKSGAGTLTLSGVNTYNGGTTVSGGRLIDLNPHGDYTTNATLEFNKAADSTYDRTVDGTGTFVKSGSGTLNVTGSIKDFVKTQIAGGTLKGNTQSFRGDVTGVGGTTLQFDQTSGGTYAARYSGSGVLLKTGNGQLTMTNAPTNAGGVRVSQGTLRINGGGTFDGGLTVDAGTTFRNASAGTLTASGQSSIRGDVTTDDGSTTVLTGLTSGAGNFKGLGTVDFRGGYNPGNSPASVLFGGNLRLSSALGMELGGTALGTGYDHLTVSRNAFLGGALNVTWYNGFVASAGQSFDLFDFGSSTGTFSSVSLPNLATNLAWNVSTLYTNGTIRVQSVPEPASLVALSLGALALLRRRKRS